MAKERRQDRSHQVGSPKTQGGKGGKGGKGKGAAVFQNWDTRANKAWKKDIYRLAIVCIEYPDVKHNAKITAKDWQDSLFSEKVYTKKSITEQKVYGSLRDYYLEQSFQKLHVEGKCFDFVTVSKKRTEYAAANTGPAKTALLGEALDKLLERDGKDALDDFDGIFFLYAGDRVQTNRGGLYWPHKANFTHKGKSWPYFIVQEGGARMCDISVICHEFGHMLGLPDLYARPEQPGSEGVGVWCAMSNQVGLEQSRSTSASVVEGASLAGSIPRSSIRPSSKSWSYRRSRILPSNASRSWAQPDGSEYFLLENRKKKGFDASLPAEGLLIWRVVQNKPILEESHGVEGPRDPGSFPVRGAVPEPGEHRVHAVHDAVEPSPARRRVAGAYHEHSPAAGWPDHVLCGV